MKGLLSILLCAAMVFSLAACGKKQVEEPEETPAATEEPVEDVAAVVEAFTLENPEFIIDEGQEYDIGKGLQGEAELYDLSIKDFSVDGTNGCEFTLTAKNKLDQPLNFTLYSVVLNGWPTDCFWDAKLEANGSANSTFVIPADFMKRCRIAAVNELQIYGQAFRDEKDLLNGQFALDEFSLYPTGMDAATARALREMDSRDGQKVINRKDMTLKILNSGFESDGFYAITCLWSNKSDNWLALSMNEFAINGYDAQNVNWDSEISPQADAYFTIYINHETMQERFAGSEDLLKALRFDYAVYNMSSEDNAIVANGTCIVDLSND